MRTMQEKIVQYAELKNQMRVVINQPDYSNHIQARHRARVSMVRAQQGNLLWAMNQKKDALTMIVMSNPGDMNVAI